jgi:hypothetical protein
VDAVLADARALPAAAGSADAVLLRLRLPPG